MSNMRVKNLLILFTLLVLAACSDKEEPLEELELLDPLEDEELLDELDELLDEELVSVDDVLL